MGKFKDDCFVAILCFATYFISIASILGSGILALPVKVHESGFWPFFCTFIFTLVAQTYAVVYMVQLLQITEQVQLHEDEDKDEDESNIELDDISIPKIEEELLPSGPDPFENTALEIEDDLKEVESTEFVETIDVLDDVPYTNVMEDLEEGGELLTEESSSSDGEVDSDPNLNNMAQNNEVITEIAKTPETESYDKDLDISVSIDTELDLEDQNEEEGSIIQQAPKKSKNMFLSEGPDMHLMGTLFLPKEIRWLYRICVWVQYITILTGYALAGPQCIGKFLNIVGVPDLGGIPLYYLFILPFVTFFTLVVLLGARCIPTLITGFTILKGSLLVFIVLLTGIVAVSVHNDDPSPQNWLQTGRPFLVGTVAVGGVVNALPIIYCKIPLRNKKPMKNSSNHPKKNSSDSKSFLMKVVLYFFTTNRRANYIRLFKWASILGLITCWLLNIFWSYEVLSIVPARNLGIALESETISTVPLIDAIDEKYSQFNWIGYLVDIFVLVSVSVSFVCLGSSFKHVLDGWIRRIEVHRNFFDGKEEMERENKKNNLFLRWFVRLQYNVKLFRIINPLCFIQWGIYFAGFFFIYLLAQLFPTSFFLIMEVFTSFTINAVSGFFIAWMTWNAVCMVRARKGRGENEGGTCLGGAFRQIMTFDGREKKGFWIETITRLNWLSIFMIIPVFLFFGIALGFDLCHTGMKIVVFFVNLGREEGEEILVPL